MPGLLVAFFDFIRGVTPILQFDLVIQNRSEWILESGVFGIAFWLISGVSFGLKLYQVKFDQRAVIVAKEASVMVSPNVEHAAMFRIHAGTIVNCIQKIDEWLLVSLPEEKKGWVKSNDLEPILFHP